MESRQEQKTEKTERRNKKIRSTHPKETANNGKTREEENGKIHGRNPRWKYEHKKKPGNDTQLECPIAWIEARLARDRIEDQDEKGAQLAKKLIETKDMER